MTKCSKIGHDFRTVQTTVVLSSDTKRERCLDCGHEETFTVKTATQDKEYAKAHRRDFIQPSDKEAWNLAYPDKRIIEDMEQKKQMTAMLREKLGKKRLPKVATQYLVSFGPADFLKWHLTP